MKRRSYGRDAGLSLRMLLTRLLLGLLYVIFAVVLFQVLSVGLVPMLVIVVGLAFFQYFTSDKLALAASGAKVVERDQAPASARHGRAALRHGRPAEAEDRHHRHAMCRTPSRPAVRPSMRPSR